MPEPTQDTTGTQNGGIQSPLTLVMPVISQVHADAVRQRIEELAASPANPVAAALEGLHSVHFARFVLLENDTRLAVITSYDGDLETYIMEFTEALGPVFDELLAGVSDAPPTPVQQHRDEFLQYVKAHNLPIVGSFYSAYPDLAVNDILAPRPSAAAGVGGC